MSGPALVALEVALPAVAVLVAVPAVVAVVLAARLVDARRRLEQRARDADLARAEVQVERADAAETRLRLERALDAIPQAVLIIDAEGEVVVRNRVADTFAAARHSDALVEAAIAELVAEALAGRGGNRTIELFGPPRRTLVITTAPMADGALAVVEDISERRRLEATRRDFVANISHELKTPVGGAGPAGRDAAGRGRPRGGLAPGRAHRHRGLPARSHHRGPAGAQPHRR